MSVARVGACRWWQRLGLQSLALPQGTRRWQSGGVPAGDSKILRQGSAMLVNYVEGLWERRDPNERTVELASPAELEAAFRAGGCALELEDGLPVDEDAVMEACKLALRYSVKANHPLFFNQLYARMEPVGLLGQWLSSAVAGNCHTYEVSPVFTMTEISLVRKFAAVVDYPKDAEGLFCPGGSISNLYGAHLARFKAFPEAKAEGMGACPPLVAFTSAHCHYSYDKLAHVLGLGTNNMVKVATDSAGRMRPDALRAAVAEAKAAGKRPFFVGATLGSTVLGAFDDLKALRAICDEAGMWLHADGAWGLPALMASSTAARSLADGISATDSFAWNPHKLMGIPIQCSIFMTRHAHLLRQCNGANAKYLFQPDKLHGDMDIGDKTIQCGRMPDSFKLWLAWRHVGDAGWTQRVDKALALTDLLTKRLQERGPAGCRFVMVQPSSFTNVCFWCLPPSLDDIDDPSAAAQDSDTWKRIHSVAPVIKNHMQQEGRALVGFQSIALEGDATMPNFFRMVFASTWSVSDEDVESIVSDMDRLGAKFFPSA